MYSLSDFASSLLPNLRKVNALLLCHCSNNSLSYGVSSTISFCSVNFSIPTVYSFTAMSNSPLAIHPLPFYFIYSICLASSYLSLSSFSFSFKRTSFSRALSSVAYLPNACDAYRLLGSNYFTAFMSSFAFSIFSSFSYASPRRRKAFVLIAGLAFSMLKAVVDS